MRRTFEQADAELCLELGDAAADGRDGHLEPRAASEMLLASATLAKITSELRSVIIFPNLEL